MTQTTTVTTPAGPRTFVWNTDRIPALYKPSRVLTLGFRRGFDAAIGDAVTGRRRPCPYSKPYAIEAWHAGYRYASAQERLCHQHPS